MIFYALKRKGGRVNERKEEHCRKERKQKRMVKLRIEPEG
jgi:hypothetical protein